MNVVVYLAGQIHDNDWRDEIRNRTKDLGLPVTFVGPMENHDRSDQIGEEILGEQPNKILVDDAASDFNNLRTEVLLGKSDIVIACFGEKYKQWNTAMDASAALSKNKPLIIIRPESLVHPLKEFTNKANVVCDTPEQAVKALQYIFEAE